MATVLWPLPTEGLFDGDNASRTRESGWPCGYDADVLALVAEANRAGGHDNQRQKRCVNVRWRGWKHAPDLIHKRISIQQLNKRTTFEGLMGSREEMETRNAAIVVAAQPQRTWMDVSAKWVSKTNSSPDFHLYSQTSLRPPVGAQGESSLDFTAYQERKRWSGQHTWKGSTEGEGEKRRERKTKNRPCSKAPYSTQSPAQDTQATYLLLNIQQRLMNLFLRELPENVSPVCRDLTTDVVWFDLPECYVRRWKNEGWREWTHHAE